MQRKLLIFASASGICAVALGAFGAHGLKPLLSVEMLAAYETGIRYQFYHTLVLLMAAFTFTPTANTLKWAARFFMAGILFFSGSLYLLAFSSLGSSTWSWLGPVTPVGGLCFMLGWASVLIYAIKNVKST
jgi:uncharacterized membrane protein YgdD (TMEM256/DUF423 family)